MSRGGRTNLDASSERRCIATGEVGPKAGLIRFVADPEGRVVPDVLEKLPGRGVWVSATRAALEKAVAKKLFARGLKASVTIPEGLVAEVEAQLARRTVDLISLARKGGTAVAGYDKVKDWLAKERALVLIQASDGSERGKTKLRAPMGQDRYIGCLTANELGLAFGRENVIHGALGAGGLSKRVVEEAKRLTGVRDKDGGSSTGKVRRPHE